MPERAAFLHAPEQHARSRHEHDGPTSVHARWGWLPQHGHAHGSRGRQRRRWRRLGYDAPHGSRRRLLQGTTTGHGRRRTPHGHGRGCPSSPNGIGRSAHDGHGTGALTWRTQCENANSQDTLQVLHDVNMQIRKLVFLLASGRQRTSTAIATSLPASKVHRNKKKTVELAQQRHCAFAKLGHWRRHANDVHRKRKTVEPFFQRCASRVLCSFM